MSVIDAMCAVGIRGVSVGGIMTFGQWIKQERDRRGLSQRALAARGDVSAPMIARLEKDGVGFSQSMVALIADALAGPDATPEEVESLRREALAASVGLSGELTRATDLEYARGRYDGELSAIREIEQFPDLKEVLDGTMETLLRQAQKRAAIGGEAGEKKEE